LSSPHLRGTRKIDGKRLLKLQVRKESKEKAMPAKAGMAGGIED
jgi:hypothetical protein